MTARISLNRQETRGHRPRLQKANGPLYGLFVQSPSGARRGGSLLNHAVYPIYSGEFEMGQKPVSGRSNLKLATVSGIILSIVMFASAVVAQDSSQSLADLARRTREAREKRASAKTTFNNDSSTLQNPSEAANRSAGSYDLKTISKEWSTCA